jgi:hypothetical protein
MDKATPAATATPLSCLDVDWFDPLEDAVRGQVRAFIEQLLEEELEAALGRGRYERGPGCKAIATAIATGGWTRRSGRWCWRCRGRGLPTTMPVSASGIARCCRPTGA